MGLALLIAVLMLSAPFAVLGSASHQDSDDSSDEDEANETSDESSEPEDCYESGYNMECNEFGKIQMETHKEVNGDPIESTTTITLDRSFEDRDEGPDARWVMFSVRNMTADGESPVEVRVDSFETNQSGDIITTREDHESNEVNLWVDVLDLPLDEEIQIEATVGVSELGAYQLETIVIPFDRAYDPLVDESGQQISLFSYTMIGVHEPTDGFEAGGGDGWITTAQEIPATGALVALTSLSAVAALTARGRER